MKQKRKKGRPSRYTETIAITICERMAKGESLRSICVSDAMPDESTVRAWVLQDRSGFSTQYMRAREAQAHCLVEEIIAIADDSSQDVVERTREDGTTYEVTDHDHINRSRLRVDARKWYASKILPKSYGDKVTQEHTGADGAPLTATVILTGRPEPSSTS